MTTTRFLLTGLLLFAAVLPIAPLLIVAVACAAIAWSLTIARDGFAPRAVDAEERPALFAVSSFRGPPAASSSR